MEKLKTEFKKNGLFFRMINRTSDYALFELIYKDKIGSEIVGYEVDRIRINKAGDRFGKHFPESESLPGNDQFGMDGSELTRSKAFFPQDLQRAIKYLNLPIRLRLEARSGESSIIPQSKVEMSPANPCRTPIKQVK